MGQSISLHSSKSELNSNVNSEVNNMSNSELKFNENMEDSDTTAIFEEPTKITTLYWLVSGKFVPIFGPVKLSWENFSLKNQRAFEKEGIINLPEAESVPRPRKHYQEKNIKNRDEVDKGEDEVKKKKEKKSKKKDKEDAQIHIQDLNALTEEKCVDSLHDDGVKNDSFNAEFLKSKKTKKRKKDRSPSQSESPNKTMEVTSVNEETDNVFYSTQLDPSKKSEMLNITFCSPILPESVSGNKKRKKEKDKRQQVLESSLALAKKEVEESSTKDKTSKSHKRKREEGSENEGVSTPKKYKNGNMYDVVYSPSPRKSYVEDKSLFSDSEKNFKISPFKKELKLNGDVHNVNDLEKCDTKNDVQKSTVQSLLDEVRKEVSERFLSESEIQNGESCQDGENNKKSKTKVQNKEEKTTKKRKKKEKEKSKIKESKETTLSETTATSLYEKLLQEAMNSINLTTNEASSASSATKLFDEKKQQRKKRTKEPGQA